MARYLAFSGWALKGVLRRHDDDTDMIAALFHNMPLERDWLLNSSTKRPTAIVMRLRYLLSVYGTGDGKNRDLNGRSGGSNGGIPPTALLRMEQVLYDIEQTIGICNRVLISPIPPTYTRHTSRVLTLYMLLLPIALAGMQVSMCPAVITAAFASYILVGIDEIGLEIENPFNLLPMYSMSKGIQNEIENQVVMMDRMPPSP